MRIPEQHDRQRRLSRTNNWVIGVLAGLLALAIALYVNYRMAGEVGNVITRSAHSLRVDRVFSSYALKLIGDGETGLFHSANCERVSAIRKENIVYFTSCKAALDRGFAPCERCTPRDD